MDAAPSSRALMAGCEPREGSGWRVHQSVRARAGPRLLRVVRGVRATIWLRRSGRPPWFAWCHGVGAAYGWDIWSDPCIFVAICKKRAHARVTRPRGLTAGPRGTHSTRQGHARDTCPRRATQASTLLHNTRTPHTPAGALHANVTSTDAPLEGGEIVSLEKSVRSFVWRPS